MAEKKTKPAVTHKKTITEEMKICGMISEDGIRFIDEQGLEQEFASKLKLFADKIVEISIRTKKEETIDDNQRSSENDED